jgi:hypothetical protein
MTATNPLPREICKWLQSLDLSFSVKNPKRDFSNGYLVAEIMSRYYPKEVNILCYENGTRIAAKVDNWEQLYKVIQKKQNEKELTQFSIFKEDIDPVIHMAAESVHTGGMLPAIRMIYKLYHMLTERPITQNTFRPPKPKDTEEVENFRRETASRRMKDPEIDRVMDNTERLYKALDTLGYYHKERREVKASMAESLLSYERQTKTNMPGEVAGSLARDDMQESVQIDEVTVKALTGAELTTRGGGGGAGGTMQQGRSGIQQAKQTTGSKLIQAVCAPRTSVGALAGLQSPALFVKPAADIMRPLVASAIQDSEAQKILQEKDKDIVVSFMEHLHYIEVETSVKVFETLSNRAQLLVDTLTKSAPEFWKVWSTFSPALLFKEESPVFGSAVILFKRLGALMSEQDGPLTQQLITDVGLPSLARVLASSPDKIEALSEIIYSYTQEDTLNHLLVLRTLKDAIGNLPVYVNCLACMVSQDAQLGLLDEHLLDLYIYYALVATQNPQPKVRVAGISILSTITMCSAQHQSIVNLIPVLEGLASDEWWEVQAQLLQLSTHLLSKLALGSRQDSFEAGSEGQSQPSSPGIATPTRPRGITGDDDPGMMEDGAVENLLTIVSRLFKVSSSKNVLQVGLSALVHLLSDFPQILPLYVAILLEQPPNLRQRLLRPHSVDAGGRPARMTYVWGHTSRLYEEKCISAQWPHLDVAKTFVRLIEKGRVTEEGEEATPALARLDLSHMEVFLASLPDDFEPQEQQEWVDEVFDKVKNYVCLAIVDPLVHIHSTQIIKRFWCSESQFVSSRCIEKATKPMLRALLILYSRHDPEMAKVDEAAVLQLLRDLRHSNEDVQREVDRLLEVFKETYPNEYAASNLHTVYA